MAGPLLAMMTQMGGMAFGSQLGQALGTLSREVLTSTDIGLPLGPKGVAALMPEAIESLAEGLEQPRSEIMTFLAAREAAHHRLFSHVPWLASQLLNAVEAFAKGMKVDMSGIEEFAPGLQPGVADRSVGRWNNCSTRASSSRRRHRNRSAALERLETLLALIEGWVQTVVTDALGDRIPGTSALSETLRRRRATGGPAEQTFATLVGLELRPRKLREAAVLWERLTRGRRRRRPRRRVAAPRSAARRRATSTSPPASSTASSAATPAASTRPSPICEKDVRRTTGDDDRPRPERPVDNSRGVCRLPWQSRRMTRYALNPAMPVLLRPDGVVQVGWDPRRARARPSRLTGCPPPRWPTCCAPCSPACDARPAGPRREPRRRRSDRDGRAGRVAGRRGCRDAHARAAAPVRPPSASTAAVRCRICWPARCAARAPGSRTAASTTPASPPETTDLVVLSDFLVADPRVVRDLHAAGIPHLPVRVRDGTGLVGPLVIPGVTSCLRCADLHRSDRDAALARRRRAAARHRRQRRPGHRAGDRGAGTEPGRPRHPGGPRRVRPPDSGRATAADPDTTLEFDVSTGSTLAAGGRGIRAARADSACRHVVDRHPDRHG